MEWLAAVALALVALFVAAQRARTVATCRVEAGKLSVASGKLPTRVLSELRDVAQRNRIHGATLRIVREDGRPRLLVKGTISPAAEQQLRNVIGRFKLAELRG